MMRSMFSGVSGLTEHQTRMDVIGNNIANVNTVGYKSARTIFEESVSQTLQGAAAPSSQLGGTNPLQVGLGVKTSSIDVIHTQGAMQSTGRPTDLALDGNGFFVLGQGNSRFYTRDGAFGLDAQARVVSPSNGLFVMGWQADSAGLIDPNLPITSLQIPLGNTIIAQASANAVMEGNLDANSAIGTVINSAMTLNDSLGNARAAAFVFTKTALNTWSWTATGVGITPGPANQGVLTYNAAGALASSTGSLLLDNSSTGATGPQAVAVDFSPILQFSSPSAVSPKSQDGYTSGVLDSFNISQDGTITGIFNNGVIRPLGQIALAGFPNPGGLSKEGGSLYAETPNAGVAQIGEAMTQGRAAIQVGTLEMSNVNLAGEFTSMITTQRGFQANSKIISVADEMLQDLVNLKR